MSDAKDKLLTAFKNHEHFCKAMLDAYALVEPSGKVIKCNQLFSTMLNLKSRQILKSDSFDDLIKLSISEDSISIKSILLEAGPTRYDEVRGELINTENNAHDSEEPLNLIIGIYPFIDGEGTNLGCFMLIRDVTAETNLQGKYKDKATQSITDALTGLYNRNYFETYLPNTLKKFEENVKDQTMCIIMCDIDYFKKINDNYGHQAGDFILEKVAQIFKDNFRKTDIVCRYGGEEFMAILPTTNLNGASQAADKLRQAVEDYVYNFQDTNIPVTISIGIAQVAVGQETGDQAIARADQALYHAKESGRNRVCIHRGGETIEQFKAR